MRIFVFAFGCYCLAVIASFFAWLGWPLYLLAHFQAQFCLAGLVFLLLFAGLGKYRLAMLALVLAASSFYRMDLFGSDRFASPSAPNGSAIRVAAGNLFGVDTALLELAELHAAQPFDLVVLTEIHTVSKDKLFSLFPGMNHLAGAPQEALAGLPSAIVLSRIAPEDRKVISAGPQDPLAINRVRYCFSGEADCLTLFAVHPYPPFTASHYVRQIAVFETLAEEVSRTSGPVLVAGDMNSVSWAPLVRGFQDTSGARRVICGQRWSPTWLAPLPGLGLELDHFFVKGGLQVKECEVGRFLGSDHWPILGSFHFQQ